MATLQQLIKSTLELQTRQPIMLTNITLLPEGQQGYSGSLLRYFEVTWNLAGDKSQQPGKTSRVVIKEAPLLERRVQTLLNQQKQAGIVPALTFDLETEIPLKPAGATNQQQAEATFDPEENAQGLLCQFFLENSQENNQPQVVSKAANALASIHFANLGQHPAWLPPADHQYIAEQIVGEYRSYWQAALEIPEFARDYGELREALEQAGQRFIAFNEMLWQEGTSLTLIHADMHNQHVLTDSGEPYFIDWGQARYGSFYLDLPNYFTPEQAEEYRLALASKGLEIPATDFRERYQEAGRYAGFKYLGFCLWAWRTFEPKYAPGWLDLIKVALDGGYGLAKD